MHVGMQVVMRWDMGIVLHMRLCATRVKRLDNGAGWEA